MAFPQTTDAGESLETTLPGKTTSDGELRRINIGLEQQLLERARSLEAANQELEAFAYSVSHDLRTPLRALDGFSQALLEDYSAQLDQRGQDYLRRIRAASQQMGRLIDAILGLSRVTRGTIHPGSVDLSALASEIGAQLGALWPDRDVALSVEDGLVARGDARLLRVALQNLLENAWKFTRDRDRATVHVGAVERDGNRWFYVRDDGAGFDMAYAGRLFQPFHRLHSQAEFEGNGIGLATVRRVVNRHGGKVAAEGKPGGGATVWFTLPEVSA